MFNCTTVAVHRQDKALRQFSHLSQDNDGNTPTDQVSLNKTRNAEDNTLFVHAHNFRVTLWMRTP